MSDLENRPWYLKAQKKAQKFVGQIELAATLQLQISQRDGTWYLHAPWARIGLKAEREALRLTGYVNKIDAYRVAVHQALASGHRILLLYTDSDYRPREQVPGAENLRVVICNLQNVEGRLARNILCPQLSH